MFFQQFTTPGLGCFSYLIGCPLAGTAFVVDPRRDADIYCDVAAKNGMRITHIFDTHVHADHISGTRELARATGASIYIHESAPVGYEAKKISNGETFTFGNAGVRVLHTPGHTPNSISLLVTDLSRSTEPEMILTGDLLFVGDTGRPDLPGEEILDEQVRNLYDSLYKVLGELPDGLEVYPAHGQGSLCGGGMSAKPHSTLGYERKANRRLRLSSYDEFKADVLSHLPMRPQSFSHIIATNTAGAPLLPQCDQENMALSLERFDELRGQGALVLDLRQMLSFGGAHIPGSINVDATAPPAPNWVGTVVAPDAKLVLVLDSDGDFEGRLTELRRIGYDNVLGYLRGGIQTWINAGRDISTVHYISPGELKKILAGGKVPKIFDVRGEAEIASGKIEQASHLPFDTLLADPSCPAGEDEEQIIVCQTGYRSAIAASLLQSRGCRRVSVLAGGMGAYGK